MYKTSTSGEWLESDADASNGVFSGFAEKTDAVEVILPIKDLDRNKISSIGDYAFDHCTKLEKI